jgi:hypothetical protein
VTNVLAWLIVMALVDVVIPVPLLAIVLIYVVLKRPRWFADFVREVYERQ